MLAEVVMTKWSRNSLKKEKIIVPLKYFSKFLYLEVKFWQEALCLLIYM